MIAVKIECIEDFSEFLELASSWEKVLSKSSHDHVCFSFEWTRAWWEAFGKGKRLFVLVAKDDENRIRAIAPLMLQKTKILGLPIRKISFIYNDNASRADFIDGGFNREIVEGMITYLKKNTRLWDVIELQNIWEGSLTYKNMQNSLRRAGICFALKDGLHSPYMCVKGDWNSYFLSRSKNIRKVFRNIHNRINNRGKWSIENERQLGGIYAISRKSWKARCNRDIAPDAEHRDFFENLTDMAEKKGWLHLWLLKVEGQGIAYEYALEYKNTMYAIKADFDESFRDLSPGMMLHAHAMKYCFEQGLRELDLCGHDDDYKKRWAPVMRNHYYVMVYKRGFYGRLLYMIDYKIGYSLKKILRNISILKRIKKKVERAEVQPWHLCKKSSKQ